MTDESPASLDTHLDSILKGNQETWRDYTFSRLKLYDFIHHGDRLDWEFSESDASIRFHIGNGKLGLNRLFLLYEIGDIAPSFRWRKLIRTSSGFYPSTIYRKTAFLPAFSLCLDRPTTLVYWGANQFFLSPENLKRMQLDTSIIEVSRSTEAVTSAANLCWPRAIDRIQNKGPLIDMAKLWLFNSLYPPKLDGSPVGWHESPFLLVGDSHAEIFSLHKTLCTFRPSSRPQGHDGTIPVEARLLDANLRTGYVHSELPSEYADYTNQNGVYEVIVVKHFRAGGQPFRPRFSLYPFDSSKLFRDASFGVLPTALSICLRKAYMDSNGLGLNIGIPGLRSLVTEVLKLDIFNSYDWSDVASRTIVSDSGLKILIELLGLYPLEEGQFFFLHPGFAEILPSVEEETRSSDLSSLRSSLMKVFEAYSSLGAEMTMGSTFALQARLRNAFGVQLSFPAAKVVNGIMDAMKRSTIPMSKFLCS